MEGISGHEGFKIEDCFNCEFIEIHRLEKFPPEPSDIINNSNNKYWCKKFKKELFIDLKSKNILRHNNCIESKFIENYYNNNLDISKPKEPAVIKCGIRDSIDNDGLEEIALECRFDNGQKFSAITVDSEFPELANKVSSFLNSKYVIFECDGFKIYTSTNDDDIVIIENPFGSKKTLDKADFSKLLEVIHSVTDYD